MQRERTIEWNRDHGRALEAACEHAGLSANYLFERFGVKAATVRAWFDGSSNPLHPSGTSRQYREANLAKAEIAKKLEKRSLFDWAWEFEVRREWLGGDSPVFQSYLREFRRLVESEGSLPSEPLAPSIPALCPVCFDLRMVECFHLPSDGRQVGGFDFSEQPATRVFEVGDAARCRGRGISFGIGFASLPDCESTIRTLENWHNEVRILKNSIESRDVVRRSQVGFPHAHLLTGVLPFFWISREEVDERVQDHREIPLDREGMQGRIEEYLLNVTGFFRDCWECANLRTSGIIEDLKRNDGRLLVYAEINCSGEGVPIHDLSFGAFQGRR